MTTWPSKAAYKSDCTEFTRQKADNIKMGLFLSRLKEAAEDWNILGAGRSAKVAMIGLDAAGKTTILYKVDICYL